MGYYTNYELSLHGMGTLDLIDDQVLAEKLAASMGKGKFWEEDAVKWYSHEIDIKNFTVEHKNIVVKLTGDGEDSDDIWVKYFKDGKVQIERAKIAYDSFDPKKLK
jgi:hypothetical protein